MNDPPFVAGVKRIWGIERKGFANVISAFPAIGQICALEDFVIASEGLSLIGTAFLDLFGYLGEGITGIVRTNHNELF
jgi:hypothetical protein